MVFSLVAKQSQRRNEMKTKNKGSYWMMALSLILLSVSTFTLYMSLPPRLNSTGLWSFGMLWFGVAVIGLGLGIRYWWQGRYRAS